MNLFRSKEISSFVHHLDDGRKIILDGFWASFKPANDFAFWIDFLPQYCDKETIRVLGPFWHQSNRKQLEATCDKLGRWDYFITGENRENCIDLATKCIGFRLPQTADEIRFPYWQWYLTYKGYENFPSYERFGNRLSIEKLMSPIQDNFEVISRDDFEQLSRKAVLLTSHFKRHRRRLWRMTEKVMGCDVFGRKIRPTTLSKKDLLGAYLFNLCPENRVAEGYITEKIPEAFLCGCIPITYCHPNDLVRDFNPAAVINLYGLSKQKSISLIRQVSTDYELFKDLSSEPLLLKRPSISALLDFLEK